jgi:hypothetical protein
LKGILFNPISISKSLIDVCNGREYEEKDLFTDTTNPDLLHSWDHHSQYSGVINDKQRILSRMNKDLNMAHNHIKETHIVLLTLGTAKVHILNKNEKIVANCHKRKKNNIY